MSAPKHRVLLLCVHNSARRKQIDARIRAWLSERETTGGPAPQLNRRPT